LDINGAKVLKKRLGPNGEAEPRPARADVDLSDDAPPVYKWLGVSRPASAEPSAEGGKAVTAVSLLDRLGLSFR
jgi:hypothetical protein